jgi:tetratricopeptide (TPR) repeat protein
VSHTSDLGRPDQAGSFVAAAVAAILRARHAVTDMAYFAARDTSPAAVSVGMVSQSDVYVGIIGLRYGSPVRDRPDLSYTELEFEAATELGQPRLIFLIREDAKHLPSTNELLDRPARQDAFRRRLLDSGLTVVWVGSQAELELAVYQALVELGPASDAPARLAAAQALLASMPVDALPERGPLPGGSRMPLAPNPLFVGRGDELLQVARALRGGDTTVVLGQVVASTGLGGLGKTQLAVELVHRYARFFAGGVFWLSFASADEIPLHVASCAAPEFDSLSLEQRVRRVKDSWQSAVPRLLVFDNCEEEALLDAWRPPSGGCRVLVTSRRAHWAPTLGVTALPLELLPRADSIELLRRYRPGLAPDDPSLDALAAELGDLPLALHLAGSYLHTYVSEVSPNGYLAELRRSDVLEHASLLGTGLGESPSPTHHTQSVAQTFALCLGRLDREREVDRVAIALLARMACMAPGEPVSRDLLAKTLEDVSPRLRAAGVKRLAAVGLVEQGDGWLRLHRLMAHFVWREDLEPMAQHAVARALIGCSEEMYQRHLAGSALAAIIPHLIAMSVTVWRSGDERVAAELYHAAGLAFRYTGHLRAARPWYERALAIRERVLGAEHPDTALSLNYLAMLLHVQGELAAARPLFERALAIRERVLGANHPDTAFGFDNLAMLLQAQGDLSAARILFERALTVRERILGPDHPDTTFSVNGLARIHYARGELDAARPLLERVLAVRERALGPEHPHTAASINNLGVLLRAQGELTAAALLSKQALAIQERVLGPDHPETAATLLNLAHVLRDQGDSAAARPLFDRVLAIRERVLGPDHPDTVATRRALAEPGGTTADHRWTSDRA